MAGESASITVLRCTDCDRLDPGPREICPNCFGHNLVPVEVSGQGKLISWTVIRRPPARFRDEEPYAVALVELDAGVSVTGRLDTLEEPLQPGARVAAIGYRNGCAIFKGSNS